MTKQVLAPRVSAESHKSKNIKKMFQKKNLKLGALKVRIPYSKCEQLLICSFKDNLIRK